MKNYELADRLRHLPFYLYPTIESSTDEAVRKGLEIIDLSTGASDFSPPEPIIQKLQHACKNPDHHRYGNTKGNSPLREAIAKWFKNRFGILPDSNTEVITFMGSKEGIAFLPLAYVSDGETVLIPDPGYPTYRYAAAFAGANIVTVPINPENNYEPDFDEIGENVAKKAKILFLNYPNNPTGATVDKQFFEKAGSFCKKHDIILCHDAAYSEVAYDDYIAPSIFESMDITDWGVEFHTFSKTFCMPGWRLGFAVGNKEIIVALLEVKKVMSSGNFAAIEMAAKEALEGPKDEVDRNNSVYKERMDFVIEKLLSFKINVTPPRGGFYVWFPVENMRDSLAFVKKVIVETGVVLFPGIGYGQNGEGYIRIAVVQDTPKLKEAFCRLEPYLKPQN